MEEQGAQLTLGKGNGTGLELEQLAHDCICLLCPVSSVLIIISKKDLPKDAAELQWGICVNSLLPPQFTMWAFIKEVCLLIVKPETPLMHRGIKSLWKQPITFHVMKCNENFYAWASQSLY